MYPSLQIFKKDSIINIPQALKMYYIKLSNIFVKYSVIKG